ncbi:uncharacterized protein LOC144158329 [Haemaphysalis longicornis]
MSAGGRHIAVMGAASGKKQKNSLEDTRAPWVQGIHHGHTSSPQRNTLVGRTRHPLSCYKRGTLKETPPPACPGEWGPFQGRFLCLLSPRRRRHDRRRRPSTINRGMRRCILQDSRCLAPAPAGPRVCRVCCSMPAGDYKRFFRQLEPHRSLA